jgi:5,10-methylenetetrahydromethanopterin reductase
MPEVWATGVSLPKVAARMAQRAERDGFDGMVVVDSQNLAGDCYVALALAARETERLRLGTGVTNPYTRHPAVTASAIASVHVESGGRAVLGIGRGDSALAHLGLAPAPVPAFEQYLERVQAYLRGDEVSFAPEDGDTRAVDTLGLAAAPTASRLQWLPPDLPKVPVAVAATGPKVIAAAARHADRVTFALGADPERVAWGIETALEARRAAGLGADGLSFGAYVNVVCHPDADVALALASGGMSTFARFNVMHGETHGPMAEESRALLDEVHDHYDMRVHTQAGSPQAGLLTPGFGATFAVLGSPDHCIARVQALVALGLDHFVIVGPSLGADPEAARAAHRRFVADVLPALH